MAATSERLSHVYPAGARIDDRGRLQVAGCDAVELAARFGTPLFVVDEEDLRARARAFTRALAERHPDAEVIFASKAFPCTAVCRVLAQEGLGCDVASGGELHMALRGGFDPERIYVHGNAKSLDELAAALDAGAGHIVLDSFDDIDRLLSLAPAGQRVLVRVAPGVRGDTHDKISTGQSDSKFGFSMADARAAVERVRAAPGLRLEGLHMHIGSQLMALEPFRAAVRALAGLGDFRVYDLGGGLGAAYTAGQRPPSIEDYVEAKVRALEEEIGPGRRLLIEPGRALVANCCVTLYTVQTVKRNVSTWVAVDGGMSDNLRPMLYGSVYEARLANRSGGAGAPCRLVGKHCESGDVIVSDALLDDPRPGDLVVTPATGAYGHAMASNYNGVPRPPIVLCRAGEARLVVRRETYRDLAARDVG